MLPMAAGVVEHLRRLDLDIADERLVRAEEEGQGPLEPEIAAVEQPADRRVGGQAQRLGIGQEADMVGAAGPLGIGRAPVGRRIERDPHLRRAADRAQRGG